jgi:hypothetical protein
MRMTLSGGGGEKSVERSSPLRERVELLVYIFLWYAASVSVPNQEAC